MISSLCKKKRALSVIEKSPYVLVITVNLSEIYGPG